MTFVLLYVCIIGFLARISESVSPPTNDPVADAKKGFIVHKNPCGGEFELESSASLKTVHHPDDYNFIKECDWSIRTSYGHQIAVIFDSFDMGDDCNSSYLAVRDHTDIDGTLIGIFCGNKIPMKFRTLRHNLRVKFVNNDPTRNASFSATLMKIFDECVGQIDWMQNSYFLSDDWQLENLCGRIFGPTETTGNISTPCFPGYYPQNKKCIWEILAPNDVQINLNFKNFELPLNEEPNGEVCRETFVEVFSMNENIVLKKHGKFCGSNLPSSILSEGNALKIIFTSNFLYNHEFAGFNAEFSHNIKK